MGDSDFGRRNHAISAWSTR